MPLALHGLIPVRDYQTDLDGLIEKLELVHTERLQGLTQRLHGHEERLTGFISRFLVATKSGFRIFILIDGFSWAVFVGKDFSIEVVLQRLIHRLHGLHFRDLAGSQQTVRIDPPSGECGRPR